MAEKLQKGSLREIAFAKVYYSIAGRSRTGVLNIVDEKDEIIRKRLYFLGGDSSFVEFGPMDAHARVDAYFDLLNELRSILGTEVDLVMVDAVKNRYIAADIERTKQALYAT